MHGESDPIRLVSRIKNNRLVECREEMGMNVAKFCSYVGISIGTYYPLASLKFYPSQELASRIASRLGYSPEYLFPGYLQKISQTVSVRTIPEPEIIALCEARASELITDGGIAELEDIDQSNFLKSEVHRVLDFLTPREAGVIRMRFGIPDGEEHTLDDVARHYGVSRERIRQVEAKALRKLHHPAYKRSLYPLAKELGFQVSSKNGKAISSQ